MAAVNGVFDKTVQSTPFPYITFGKSSSSDWSSKTTQGGQCNISIHIWSREGGRKEAASIMERVYILLHDTHPSVSGYEVVMLRFADSKIELGNDGWTYQAVISFKALLQKTA